MENKVVEYKLTVKKEVKEMKEKKKQEKKDQLERGEKREKRWRGHFSQALIVLSSFLYIENWHVLQCFHVVRQSLPQLISEGDSEE